MEQKQELYDLAIVGGRCLTFDADFQEISDSILLIRDGKISWIGDRKDYPGRYRAKVTLQASGKLIMPALINAHTHLSLSLYRGLGTDLKLHDWLRQVIWPLEKKFCTPDNVYLGSCLSLLEMIKSGTGTLADMNFFSKHAAKAVDESGLRGFIGEALFSTPTPSIADPRDGLNVTSDIIEQYKDHSRIHPYVVLHAPFTCSGELYQESSALAKKWGLKVCSHVAETSAEIEQIGERYHLTPVEWLDSLGVLDKDFIAIHAVHLSDHDKEILRGRNVGVIHNPHSNMMLGSGICPVPELKQSGVRVGLGTDSAASNNTLSMLFELQTAAKLHKMSMLDPSILPAREVLRMATSVNADILGLGKVTGTLAAGFSADLILIDPSSPNMLPLHDPYAHIVYSMENNNIESLVVAGRVIMEKRKIMALDEEIILKEVIHWMKSSSVFDFILTNNA
ncbi:MAG: amidohydrolase [Bacteroidales bacterium]|jgi:5-methylthioadenosine/S-adenosylhomocysteine deaminase